MQSIWLRLPCTLEVVTSSFLFSIYDENNENNCESYTYHIHMPLVRTMHFKLHFILLWISVCDFDADIFLFFSLFFPLLSPFSSHNLVHQSSSNRNLKHQSCIHRNSKQYPSTSIYLWFDKYSHKFNDTTFKQLVYKLINVEINSSASFHAHLIIIYHMQTHQMIGRRVQIVNYKIQNDDNRKIVTKAQAAHQHYRCFQWQHEWKRERKTDK